jgi:hypothetical protein
VGRQQRGQARENLILIVLLVVAHQTDGRTERTVL